MLKTATMDPESLIIFDYSGTLSLQAPQFARTDYLVTQLVECGLSAFGITRADIFWNEIANPTWDTGSTTPAGYITLMENRIRERRMHETDTEPMGTAIHDAATLFVRRYMTYSVIDPRWEPLLMWLNATPGLLTVIATDHYAEATDAILCHLKDWHIEGIALRDIMRQCREKGNTIVANSADLGVHKVDRSFWETVRAHLPLHALRQVLVVDDFGAHEQPGDAYGTPSQISWRRRRTTEMLKSVFQVPVKTADFQSSDPGPSGLSREAGDALIKKTMAEIRHFLKKNPASDSESPGFW